MTTLGEKIRGIAYFGLALGFGYSGYETLFGHDGPEGLHGDTLGDGKNKGQLKQTNKDVGHIDERVKFLRKLLKKAGTNGRIHEIASEILSQKQNGRWLVPEKDCWAEVTFIFHAIRDPSSKYAMRYTRDSVTADIFSDADRSLLKTHAADCDDYAIAVGGLLMSVGHQVKIRVIQTEGEESWNHVYLLTPADWDGNEWKAIDVSMDKPPGWEASGAAEAARTGKPSGIVLRVKDYDID